MENRQGLQHIVKIIGTATEESRIQKLEAQAIKLIEELQPQLSFDFEAGRNRQKDKREILFERVLTKINRPKVTVAGPELILGSIFDYIGFGVINEPLFRDIVLSRLTYPVSKLKTTEYLMYHKQKEIEVTRIYRFLDRFYRKVEDVVKKISYGYTQKIVGGISIVFYDMTTLYFEAEDEDDLRKIGYSKDGKFRCPQIMLGLLVSENGYPIDYDIFEGNTFESHTLIPIIEKLQAKYGGEKPTIIADSGLLSKSNIEQLMELGFDFIIGARIKGESGLIKNKILSSSRNLPDGGFFELEKGLTRLVVGYSKRRAYRDARNRERGIRRLEKNFKSGKITKESINNKGYNKFLTLQSDVSVEIDPVKIAEDMKWDGLKGYITNSKLPAKQIIQNYKHLWHIEKAFRISKTDLRIRPIYHRKRKRIEAHICIAFVAYTIYKELERRLKEANVEFSPEFAIELTKTIYKIDISSPDTEKTITTFSCISGDQELLLKLFNKNYSLN